MSAELSLETLPQEDSRYQIRLLEARDAPDVHRLANDWEVVRMLSNLPFPYPRGLAESWIASTQAQARAGTAWHLAVEHHGKFVGCIGVTYEKLRKAARIGYWVGRAYWGRGIATYAVATVTNWALENLQVTRVYADVSIDNAASIAVLKRLDFQQVGTATQHLVSRGREQPIYVLEKTSPCDTTAKSATDMTEKHEVTPATDVVTHGQISDTASTPLLLVVAAALIDKNDRILLATRPEGKSLAALWEFPGGKIEAGETPEVSLQRELREELGITIDTACIAPFAFASHNIGARHLLMPLYLCRDWTGTPTPQEGQRLAWVTLDEISLYPMPEADAPLIPMLRTLLA